MASEGRPIPSYLKCIYSDLHALDENLVVVHDALYGYFQGEASAPQLSRFLVSLGFKWAGRSHSTICRMVKKTKEVHGLYAPSIEVEDYEPWKFILEVSPYAVDMKGVLRNRASR